MESAIRSAILKPEQSTNEVLTAIREVCSQLENANMRFALEKDSDLIEACIFEIESLRARYRYLLRLAKKQGVKAGVYAPLKTEGENQK